MPRKDKVIHISNLPSTFRGNITRNGRFIQNGIPPLGGAYDKVAKSTGLIRLGNEFLYNGVNNLVSKDNREKLMNNTAGRLINYVKDFNKESLPSDDELGPTFPFNIIQTTRSNGRNLPQKQYAVGGKIPNVVAGGIAQPLGNNFFYMNGRKHSQGGIDIGPSDKTGIEVEDGEVVETNGNELKVYSAQPIINGISPARLVMGGANPNKVFQAQENFKDRNGINDDGTKAQYGITKEGEGLFDKIDNYADIAEKTLAIPNMATSTATLLAPNPYTAVASYITGLGGAAIDVYQLSRALYKKDYPNVVKNAIDIGTSIIGLRALRNAKKLRELDKVLRTSGADREIVHKTIGRTTKTKRTIYMTKEANKASNYEAVGYTAIPFSSALNLADTDDANNKKKLGGKNMIVNISGNVKNGLIHSPSSTGGLRDKFAVGGTRVNYHGTTPAKGTTSSDGKGQGKFKNITAADWIGLGSNMAGSLASYFASRRAINKMRGPGQPTLISANKLKTKYNINPQLDRIREDKFEAYRDIDSNTASSRVSLARKQRVRNAAGQAANELYGNKENIETNLINQDRRNQQSVRQFNAQQYNQYIDRKAAFDNGIREAKVTNINNLFSGINAGIQDMISRYENRKALNNTISAMRASAPNVDDRIMRDAGVDYDEFIIRKRRKLGGKQSCR